MPLILTAAAHRTGATPAATPARKPSVLAVREAAIHGRGAWLARSLGAAVLACAAALPAAFAQAPAPAQGPLWFAQGRPVPEARQAVDALGGVAADGLDPRDYDADALRQAVTQAATGPVLPPDAAARLDAALTAAMERMVADLHAGRVNPRAVHANFSPQADRPFDVATVLRDAVAQHRLPDAVQQAAPSFPLYGTLRQALARYREIARQPVWLQPLPALPDSKLTPGQRWAGIAALAGRLAGLGDLPAGTPVPPRYEGALVEGVKAFQSRHGLQPDGVIGQATLAQLNAPIASRVRQIELTMERMRWTPLDGPRMVVVNVPEFMLRAYEVRDGKLDIKLEMKVIVGKALDTRTPLFSEDMRYIEFSPYWNVPPSIAKRETIPRLRQDPGYFNRQGLEFVTGDGKAVTTLSEENLDAVLNGRMRIRQRPGPTNALGDIKFAFPNNENIYLHHTPTPQLFKRDRRDFSHGCIRVETPVALAQFVMQDMPEWTEARIHEAMTRGKSKTVRLQQPLPVVLAYGTVIARADGRVSFLPDIYGHDKLLDNALRQRTGRATLPALARARGSTP
ncbi:L,D-transpeptidase family protein [Cupriavidus necator]|uniref:L,D-transpeptidase family protein n=1 Tax=Cupriavidus necator TaxID=106590 RepID=UPI0009B85255|nr:L,D-transpeptidase family protein [Cupriavidus necator]